MTEYTVTWTTQTKLGIVSLRTHIDVLNDASLDVVKQLLEVQGPPPSMVANPKDWKLKRVVKTRRRKKR
jgi:hypothetical protein